MPETPPTKRSLFWRSRRLWYSAVVVIVQGAGGVWRLLDQLELPETTLNPLASTSLICDASVPVGECDADNAAGQIFSGTESLPLAYDDIPLVVKQAVVASEDRKFFEHQGLDPFGIARGLYQNSKGGGSLQGGSTITQQYVKLAYLENKRSRVRNVQESGLALKLERSMPKEKILENYLNKAFYGRSATGIEAAARVYFDKPAADLSASEAAFLVGLVRNPARAEPTEHQETAVNVRNSVLAAMVEEGYLPQSTYDTESKLLVVTTDPSAGESNGNSPRNFTIPDDLKAVGYEYILAQARTQAKQLLGGDDAAADLVNEGGVASHDDQRLAEEGLRSGRLLTLRATRRRDGDLDKAGRAGVVGGATAPTSTWRWARAAVRAVRDRRKPIVLAEFIKQGYNLTAPSTDLRIIVPEVNIDGTD
jgi:membrane peptidoglycan carboxypeptidase